MSTADERPCAEPLLGDADPPPVELLRPDGSSPFFLTCEHAGRAIPAALGNLGLDQADLERHIGWDIGAAAVARRLSGKLDAPLVLQRYSRLVVDCNRWPQADDFIVQYSDGTAIPGNRHLSAAAVEARSREIYLPYHQTIAALLDRRGDEQRRSVVVAVHSFTPVLAGLRRPWHVGVLYEHDATLARELLEVLVREEHESGRLVVGDNEPYFLSQDRDYAVPVHGHARGLLHVELEIRQDLIAAEPGQEEWAARLARTLTEALGRIDTRPRR